MGCAQSKIEIEKEESVCRCKDSLHFLIEAVTARIAFDSALPNYAMALKNTGSALSDYYGQGEAYHTPPPSPSPPLPPPPLLPPPPPKRFSKEDEEIDIWDYYFNTDNMPQTNLREEEDDDDDYIDEEEEEEEEEELHHLRHHQNHHQAESKTPKEVVVGSKTPEEVVVGPKTPEEVVVGSKIPKEVVAGAKTPEEVVVGSKIPKEVVVGSKTPEVVGSKTPEEVVAGAKTPEEVVVGPKTPEEVVVGPKTPEEVVVVSSSVNLLMILLRIEDCFLRAFEDVRKVSIATKFADNRGQIDNAAKAMRRIRSLPYGDNWKGCAEEKAETHAIVLDKLLACEKKLFEEVKAGELMKLEYQRKLALLNKLKKRSASTESLEKTKAAVSHLHTRYIVDMQSLDSTVSEVNDIRDKQLYPKLVALVDGMSKMWDSMCEHHDNQLTIVSNLKSLDASGEPKETTKHHYERTVQLYHVVQGWHSHFETLVTHQKHYVQALNNWLKLNLIPIESSLKEKISSPPRIQTPPIQSLLHSWHDHLQKLPDELAKSAISSFAAVIETIMNHQEEEMKLKDKWEETRKEYLRKNQAFEDWYQKYIMRRGPQEETGVTGTDTKDPIAERQFVVESLKKRLEDEMEAHQKLCVQVRDKSLGSLKIRLPELFRAMSDYAHVCRDSYQRLRLIIHSQNRQNGS